MISESNIQLVKDSVVTYDIVSSFISLKKKGTDYVACCPYHDEKTPSFSVSPVKNIYKCFGCGKSGNGITFLMEHQRMSFIEAIKWVAEKNNIQIEEEFVKKSPIKPQPRLELLNKEFIEYFEKRGISNNTLLRFGVTESLEWMPKAKKEVRSVCFNYIRESEIINIKFRASNKDFKMSKDAELILYNLDAIKDEEIICITEGEIDCMSVFEAGFYNVVSVPNGAAANGNNQRLEYLNNCWNYFTNKTKVILMTDNDTAGNKLREELARRIGYGKCYLVDYIEGCKDANDVLVKHGKVALANMIESARVYPLQGEVPMDDMYETVIDFYENGYPTGYESGISNDFDNHLKFYPGQLTIVTGIPGCFTKEQKVHTSVGVKKISDINIGDHVLSYNHHKKINEYKAVTNTVQHKKHTDKLYKITLKDGTIIKVTENHKFFTGIDYVKIKDILLPLVNGNKKMAKNTKV